MYSMVSISKRIGIAYGIVFSNSASVLIKRKIESVTIILDSSTSSSHYDDLVDKQSYSIILRDYRVTVYSH